MKRMYKIIGAVFLLGTGAVCIEHSDEIMIVGDTFNDIVFAERCGGIPVAVLSGVSSKQDFKEYPDYILRSVGEIPTLLNTIEKAEALQNKKVEQ